MEALKKFGLADETMLSGQLFEPNTTDDTLRRVTEFLNAAKIPSLKGKKRRFDPFVVLMDYSVTLFILNRLKRKYRNLNLKFIDVKGCLPEIFSKMLTVVRKGIPDNFLKDTVHLPRRTLALNLVAYIYGISPDALRKYLTQARKKYPREAHLWKNGLELIKSQ